MPTDGDPGAAGRGLPARHERHARGEGVPAPDLQALPLLECADRPEADATRQAIGQDWREVVDHATGTTFYHNVVTNKTSWSRPVVCLNSSQ